MESRGHDSEKINNLQVIKIKGDLPGNPSNELPCLALHSPPVAQANSSVIDAGDVGYKPLLWYIYYIT